MPEAASRPKEVTVTGLDPTVNLNPTQPLILFRSVGDRVFPVMYAVLPVDGIGVEVGAGVGVGVGLVVPPGGVPTGPSYPLTATREFLRA